MRPIDRLLALAPSLLPELNKGIEYKWPPRGALRMEEKLAASLPDADVEAVFAIKDKERLNYELRELVGPLLMASDKSIAGAVAKWIVADWGGIRRGTEIIPKWLGELGDFSDARIQKFVASMGAHRISSWSKLLAFAKPNQHAIYDARTAVAINCALASISSPLRFSMPASRNKAIMAARELLSRNEENWLGYREYLVLLDRFRKTEKLTGILAAEMMIFSNAPEVASSFSASNKA